MKKLLALISILALTTPFPTLALTYHDSLSYVDIPSRPSKLNIAGAVTLTAWVYPQSLSGAFENIIIKGKSHAADADASCSPWGMVTRNGQILFSLRDTSCNGATLDIQTTQTIPLNTWSFVAATWDGTTGSANQKIYLNGVLILSGSQATISALKVNTLDLTIGYDKVRVDTRMAWKGSISDARIFNRALSNTEIKGLYYGTSVYNNLIGFWRMTGAGNNYEPDMSGNGFNGYLTGDAGKGRLSPALRFRR